MKTEQNGTNTWHGWIGAATLGWLLLAGCNQIAPARSYRPVDQALQATPVNGETEDSSVRVAYLEAPVVEDTPAAETQPLPKGQPTSLPPADMAASKSDMNASQPEMGSAKPAGVAAPKILQISLDKVLQLAQDQSGQLALARARVRSAFAERDLAGKYLLPLPRAVSREMDAEGRVWEKKGELVKLTSEHLLDATGTYVDLLAAMSGEAVSHQLETYLEKLHDKTKIMEKAMGEGVRVEVVRVLSELDGQKQINRKLREKARAARAKLVYALGLDPDTELVPLDRKILPFTLVDDQTPLQELVDRALNRGPGIREMEGLLAFLDQALQRPAGFRAAAERRRVAEAREQEARLSYADLRAKLVLGVTEAREASVSNREQLERGILQVKNASEAYNLSLRRLENINVIKNASPSEVLLAIRALGGAQLNYITAVREHDKAQLRLFVLTGHVDMPEPSE
jgi:outer membrane protein TolC